MNTDAWALLACAAAIGGGWGAAQAAGRQNRLDPGSATGLWMARCADCHGENAGGVKGKAATLLTDAAMEDTKDRPFYELLRKASGPHGGNGEEGDTAGSRELTEQQTWALIVHLRELQARDWRKRVKDPRPGADGAYPSRYGKFKIETVIGSGLNTPWSIDWRPAAAGQNEGSDGGGGAAFDQLVTERDGRLTLYRDWKLQGEVKGLPKLVANGQGGLMDVAVHPEFAKNGWVYIAFAEAEKEGSRLEMTKVVRGKITRNGDAFEFTDQTILFQPHKGNYNGPGVHYGSRIVFQRPTGDDAKEAKGRWLVYFSIGERGGMEEAQTPTRPNGKVHRVWDDGQVPSSNPFIDQKDAYGSVWTVGHRNQQGLCFDAQGNLWDTEHGPRGGDELNLIARGADYGWPQTCFGINYSDQPFVVPWKDTATNGMPITPPVYRWLPSIAACGLDCARPAEVQGTFPQWAGDLFAGGLAGQNVDRLRIKDAKLVEREEIVHGMGRVRDVAFGPDGLLYLVLNGPDKIVRLVPAK